MTLAELLLQNFDTEARNTRTILERIPTNLIAFKPHEKSMPMGRLAIHTATLPRFATTMLTTPGLDLGTHKFPRDVFESSEQTLKLFEETSAEARGHIASASDEDLSYVWSMVWGDKPIAKGPRGVLLLNMFQNHQIHHRAQLGVYLRLNNLPVPGTYGPSADDTMGF